jgi:glycosyltransferase involved in cell wall biosynthesis
MVDDIALRQITEEETFLPKAYGAEARMNIVAIIPAYNEEKTIGKIIAKTQQHVTTVIVVNDGSTDKTAEIAEKQGATILTHYKRLGYGAALKNGLAYAKKLQADITITLDADDQHNPDEIPLLVNRIQAEQSDIVIGSRFLDIEDNTPFIKRAGIKLITGLTNHGGVKLTDAQSGFRAYTKEALRDIELMEDGMGISTEIVVKSMKSGYKICEVPIHISYPKGSSINFSMFKHGVSVILSTLKYSKKNN